MSDGFPSMTALLGLVALAGYQNRDKISEMLADAKSGMAGGPDQGRLPSDRHAGTQRAGGQGGTSSGGLLEELGGLFGGSAAGGTLANGMGELRDRFRETGRERTADSWIATGPNEDVDPDTLHQTLGDDTVRELALKTGLTERQVLERLSAALPSAVDRFSPEGRLPTREEADRWS